MKKCIAILIVSLFCAFEASAQRVEPDSGSLEFFKDVKNIQVEFIYEGMGVGKYKTEQEFIDHKTSDCSEKKGQKWLASWNLEKTKMYQPAFMKSINKQFKKAGIQAGENYTDTPYRMVVQTTFFEKGFAGYGLITMASQIDLVIRIYSQKDPGHPLSVIKLTEVGGSGGSPGTAYAYAGKILGHKIRDVVNP
jgi:hypothetical protein